MWTQNNLWVYVGIFVSGLMKLRSENLYLNKAQKQQATNIVPTLELKTQEH